MPDSQTTFPPQGTDAPARLIVLVGPQAGLRFDLGRRNVLGRAVDCPLSFDDAGVSRKHAEIRRGHDGAWEIEDLASRNGTRVNGSSVQRSRLLVGDRIQLGPNVLLLFTDRSAVEEALIERQKFELLGRLAAGIAHDFNNMLSVMSASASCLRTNSFRSEREGVEKIECLDDMDAAVANGARLTRRLLGFARGSRRGRSVIDASAVCKEVAQMCRRTFEGSIRFELDTQPDLLLLADEGEIEQILMNLCVNARDAMPLGGTLTLRASESLPGAEMAHKLAFARPHVLLTVQDTGSGIEPSLLPHVFEPFFSTKEPGAGFGVGLATVKELVTVHGGGVEVESEPGRGTTFRVFLPLAHAAAGRTMTITPDAFTSRAEGGGRRLLVVDDDDLVRRSTARLLTRAGFDVLEAGGGRDAIQQYVGGPRIALVLLDLDMPDLDGLQTFAELKRHDASVKVLVVSGHHQSGKEQAARAAGASFLSKPFETTALIDAVRNALLDPSLWSESDLSTHEL